MMKRILFLAAVALFPFGLSAQPEKGGRRFDPEQFRQHMEATLTREAELTPEEAQAFFPLYDEMREKQRALGKQIHQLKKEGATDAKGYAALITRIKQLQVEMAQTEQTYYKRILKVVPPEKVFRLMKAEDDFHRRMVQGQHQQRPQNGHSPQKGQRKR